MKVTQENQHVEFHLMSSNKVRWAPEKRDENKDACSHQAPSSIAGYMTSKTNNKLTQPPKQTTVKPYRP